MLFRSLPILPASTAVTRYQVRLAVDDRPGVLAQVAQVLASKGVSIEAVRQPSVPGAGDGEVGASAGVAHLVITTHAAAEAALAATVDAIAELEPVREITSVLRVEGA